jgi:uncharacterized membrane protein YhaH (DUF805 family)
MSLQEYFLSAYGRISRLEYWLGMVGLMAVTLPVAMWIDPEAFAQARDQMRPPSLAGTLWSLIVTWPSATISIKRFNDRDWPWWPGFLLGIAMAGLVIANHNGYLLDPDRMSPAEKLLLVALVIGFVWSMIENGFMRGTDGPNRYGPDPLSSSGSPAST